MEPVVSYKGSGFRVSWPPPLAARLPRAALRLRLEPWICPPQERELAADESAPAPNVVFDDSGNFVLYPTLLGIKVRRTQCHAKCPVLCEVPVLPVP